MNARLLVCTIAALALTLGACAEEAERTPTAVATVLSPPSVPTPTPMPTPVRLTDSVFVQWWESPQPGWVFVLDHDDEDESTRVYLVDPFRNVPGSGAPLRDEVRGSIQAGYWSEIALSADGSRLFLAQADPPSLVAIDTSDASLVWEAPAELVISNPPRAVLPTLQLSADGSYLYASLASSEVAAFDTATGAELGRVSKGPCPAPMRVWPDASDDGAVIVECGRLRVSSIEDGQIVPPPSAIDFSSDSGRIWEFNALVVGREGAAYATTYRGLIHLLDLEAAEVERTISPKLDPSTRVPLVPALLSSDAQRLYMTVTRESGDALSGDAIEVVDLEAGMVEATVEPGIRISSVALTRDGSYLYIADREAGVLAVFDTSTLEEVARVELGRATPLTLLVMPETP